MDPSCIFCKITSGDIPAEKIHEDAETLVFKDIHPIAPVHLLVIPKKHVSSLDQISADALPIMQQLYAAVQTTVKKLGLNQTGYRTIINTGPDSGQIVLHLHLHVIGGRKLGPLG